jgi:hypothetical protein
MLYLYVKVVNPVLAPSEKRTPFAYGSWKLRNIIDVLRIMMFSNHLFMLLKLSTVSVF